MDFVDRLADRRDGFSDEHLDLLAQPQVFGAGQPDRHDRNAAFHREVCKASLERLELALSRSDVALRKQRDCTAQLEASEHVSEKSGVMAERPVAPPPR